MPLCQLLISDSDIKLLLASILPESYRTAECPRTIHASKEDSLSQNHETKIKKGQPSVERFENEGGCQWQAVVENKNQTIIGCKHSNAHWKALAIACWLVPRDVAMEIGLTVCQRQKLPGNQFESECDRHS
jgi:hypothetical protein